MQERPAPKDANASNPKDAKVKAAVIGEAGDPRRDVRAGRSGRAVGFLQ